jgi:outer membrane receptor protein involved in Fe transport
MKFFRLAVAFVALTALFATGLQAQQITATLRGKVIDTDGVGLPGVPVSVSSGTHGSAGKTVMTDIEGRFKFQLLPPSNDYFIKINYPGFAPIELGPVDLDPGKTTVQDVTLRTSAELTETVEVVAHGNVVDTESTKTSSTFNTEFIEGLPIIGRNYQDILTLTPGVTDSDGDGNPNVQGARDTGLQYRLDGGNITDPVSGTFGQNFNTDAIEEIEVITAGASAEYGRADGGFANIITKSGGNDMEGSFRAVWRGQIFDGDGAGENIDTFESNNAVEFDSSDTRYYGTIGGAILKDKVWYFVSSQKIDTSLPINLAGASFTQSSNGFYNFAKTTWQVDSDNKLALQWNSDFRDFQGLFLGFGVDQDSDGDWHQGGNTYQLRWTSIISPTLLLETLLTAYDSGISIVPVSDDFHIIDITRRVNRTVNQVTLQAEYPIKECSANGQTSGFIPNCDPALGNPTISQFNLTDGTITGPLNFENDDSRIRNSIKTDLTYTLEDAWGEHQIKSGLEFADEKFHDEPINNPFFVNSYEACSTCRDTNGQPILNAIEGFSILTVPSPTQLDQRATSFNSSAYVTDTWKPKPNLTINLGVRIDREDVDTSGFDYFKPRDERRRSIAIVEGLCADGLRIAQSGNSVGANNADGVCDLVGRLPGALPTDLTYTFDGDSPESVRRWDVDGDGIFSSGGDRINGLPVQASAFTDFEQRNPENFEITNLNLSPRFSISWDPWADGKTKVFSSWGRYFDRLFLSTVSGEIGPDTVNYRFDPDPAMATFQPGQLSRDTSAVSVAQIDRNLKTPFTDVFTIGIERELAPEWSARVTFTQRLGWDLLQDTDFNHIQCLDFQDEFGINPADVCTLFTDGNGKPVLSDDLFGAINAPDLYNVNPNFNQVLRVGNFNSSKYRSIALEINKRLHRNWQMQTSYTFSEAEGQAEGFAQALGNDPSTSDDEAGYLSFDQRHRVLVITTTQLPKDVELGASITWESGIPFSVQSQVIDSDDVDNTIFRTFYPTNQRNDQRNNGFWGVNLKTVKRFLIGKVQAAGELSVNNLLNNDDVTLSAYRPTSISGIQLVQGPQGLRRFGRFWEIALTMNF